MSLSIYQASIPTFLRTLGNLSAILKKAAAHAEAKNIDPRIFIDARLAPDMFPWRARCRSPATPPGAGARLAGLEVPSYADTETTFDELQARIARTVEFLEGIREEQLDGAEERNVTLKVRGQEISFNGRDFLFGFALPNFFFHVTTAYAILRHNGVELGKMDFLGGA